MKRLIYLTLILILLIVIVVKGYLFAKPKVIFTNLSENRIDEFQLQLPTSRIVIGPVEPGGHEIVYFSFQETSGETSYSVRYAEFIADSKSTYYESAGQLFRKYEFIFHPDGGVEIDIRE